MRRPLFLLLLLWISSFETQILAGRSKVTAERSDPIAGYYQGELVSGQHFTKQWVSGYPHLFRLIYTVIKRWCLK